MKATAVVTLFFFQSIACFAQSGIADNWYFGVLCGMKFSSTTSAAIPSSIVTNEGSAGISDTSGNPLFYTNGVTVWDKNHQVMPNGTGLNGDESATQSALIVPDPGSNTMYYIFTVDEIGGPNGFCYSLVDITMNGGFGDVLIKNVPVQSNVTEKLTAVARGDAPGNYWIAVHENNSDAFYLYTLTGTGLSFPIVSNTGIVHSNTAIQNTYGQMKFSPCGNKIALAAGYLDTVEVFDFNNATGIVSNPITLPFGHHVYGIEFSQNGQLLYVSTYNPLATLVQFDLSSGNPATILASQTVLSATPDIYGLQLANNSKIYVCKSFSTWLGAIELPHIAGTGCNYNDTSVFLDPNFTGASAALSLPSFVQSAFRNETSCITTSVNQETNTIGKAFPNPSATSFYITPSAAGDLYIYDNTGRAVAQYAIDKPQLFSFGDELEEGIYHCRLNDHRFSIVKLR